MKPGRQSGPPTSGTVAAAVTRPVTEEPKYRSAAERRQCEDLMRREGVWDGEAETYRTRESLLQQRTQLIQRLHLTLRVDHGQWYASQANDPEYTYPQCPRELLRQHQTKSADLGINDPRPEHVERCLTSALERRARPTPLPPSSRVGSEEAVAELEAVLLQAACGVVGTEYDAGSDAGRSTVYATTRGGGAATRAGTPPRTSQSRAAAGNQTPSLPSLLPRTVQEGHQASPAPAMVTTVGPDEGALPDVGSAGPNAYSSLLMELKRTKNQHRASKPKHAALHAILDMDANPELKRTITRMFADPKNATAISAEEAQRRAQRWSDERSTQLQLQSQLLQEERQLMDKELAQLKP